MQREFIMEFIIGQSAYITKTINKDDVILFGELVGDKNPIHFDDEFAKKSQFGKCIVQGMFGASLISAVLGTKLPGPGVIYLGQTLRFTAPMYIGDTITANVIIVKIREDKPIITLETNCKNQNGNVVIEGEAVLKI